MVFGIGQIQQGMNDSDDRYQTKRLNNLKLYNLWKQSFPTAPISAHQDYLNSLSGNDRWLKKQLPSNEALMAFDAERARKRKLAEADRQYTEMIRKMEVQNKISTMLDDVTSTGVGLEQVNKTMLSRLGADSPLGKMYQERYANNQAGLNARISTGRLNKVNAIVKQIGPLKLDESQVKLQLNNMGIQENNPIFKGVVSAMGRQEAMRVETKQQAALVKMVQSPSVARAAMGGSSQEVMKALKQQQSLYGVTIPDATLQVQADNAVANFDEDKFVIDRASKMQVEAGNAARQLMSGATVETVRADLELQLGSLVNPDLKEKIVDRVMALAQTTVSAKQDENFVTTSAAAGTTAQTVVDAQVQAETQKETLKALADGLAVMVESGADDMDEKEVGEQREKFIVIGKAMIVQGAQLPHIKKAVQKLREEGKKFQDINESVITNKMISMSLPTTKAARVALEKARLTRNIIDPEPVKNILTGAAGYVSNMRSFVDSFIADNKSEEGMLPAVFDEQKTKIQKQISERAAELTSYVENPQYLQSSSESDITVLKNRIKDLNALNTSLTNEQSIVRETNATERQRLLIQSAGGQEGVRPEAYQQALQKQILELQKMKTNRGMRKARAMGIAERPGYEVLQGIINQPTALFGGANFERYLRAIDGIIVTKQGLIQQSKEAQRAANAITD